jgi:tRNA(fMet)-specific endonuclease VapC
MSTLLVDTNVVSFLFKGDTRSAGYETLLTGHRLAVSFMTVAELFEWAATRRWGARRLAQLEETLAVYLFIPVDMELCRTWGTIRVAEQSAGRVISPQDAWIAATAIRHGLPLVTHNPADFATIADLDVRTTLLP